MSRFYRRAGVYPTLEDAGGNIVWTAAGGLKSLQRMDPATLTLTGQSVVFPDLIKRNAYWFAWTETPFSQDVCDSFVTIIGQEWGPGRANDLPRTLLGTVPGSTDALDIQAKLVRTVAPSQMLGFPVYVLPKEGEWIPLVGGACPLEDKAAFARGFKIVLGAYVNDATPRSVYLERYQTVQDGVFVPWRSDNAGGNRQQGWTHGGGANSNKGLPVHRIQSRGGSDGIAKYRNNGGCSLSDPTNYGSTYSVDLIIAPVRRS